MNKVTLIGRLGKDAETQTFESGKKLTKFPLATTKSYGDKETAWHNIEYWGDSASNLAPYLKKGAQISVEGEIKYSNYEKDGEKKSFTSINCFSVELLDSKRTDDASATPNNYNQSDDAQVTKPKGTTQTTLASNTDDDLPF